MASTIHNGWVEMDCTITVHDSDYLWEVELKVVCARTGRNLGRLQIPKLPGSLRVLQVFSHQWRLLPLVMQTHSV